MKFLICVLALSVTVFFSGCGHHKRPRVEVAVINSVTVPSAPDNMTIVVETPTSYAQDVLLGEILDELREFNAQEPTADVTNITVEVTNTVEVDASVDVDLDNNVLRVHPGRQRRCPKLRSHLLKLSRHRRR